MSSKLILSVAMSALALVAGAAQAQSSNFSRDRNFPVAGRVPAGYEAQGIRVRSFILSPQVTVGLEKHDNIFFEPVNKTRDLNLSVAPSLSVRSDWGRHSVSGAIAVGHTAHEKNSSENITTGAISVAGRYDVVGGSNIFGGLSLNQNYEPRYSPSIPADAASPIKFTTDVANAGFVAEGNRLKFSGRIDYAKYDYFDVESNGGGLIDQDFRDYKRTEFTARADYAVSPSTSLFLVYGTNTRDYVNSNLRDSDGYDVGLGTSFDITNLVTGEVQVGYVQQEYKNPAFANADSSSYKGVVQYFPTMMTTVTVRASRAIEETPAANASGYVSSAKGLSVDHEFTRTVIGTASVSHIDDDYEGVARKDHREVNQIGFKYFVTPRATLNGGYTFYKLSSKGASAIPSFKDNAFKVSVSLKY